MKKALISCTGNSCRSQMAERLWNQLGARRRQAVSAGSNPAGYIHSPAIEAMREIGVDWSRAASKRIDQLCDESFNLAATVCDNARQLCPVFPNARQTLHWPFDDRAYFQGSEAERRAGFARVRNEIAGRIRAYVVEDSR